MKKIKNKNHFKKKLFKNLRTNPTKVQSSPDNQSWRFKNGI